MSKKQFKPWNVRLERATELNTLVVRVQRRMRREGVYVHRVLVRYIVYLTLNTVTQKPPRERQKFIDRWARGEYQYNAGRLERLYKTIRKRYSREWFETPRVRVLWRARMTSNKGTRQPKLRYKWLNDRDTVILEEIRDDAALRGDGECVQVVDKLLKNLRA